MELWDTVSDNENDTDSSYGLSDFGSESDSTVPAPRGCYFFVKSSKNFCKIPQKTFRKLFHVYYIFRLSSTRDVFPRSFTNLARAVVSHNISEWLVLY